MKPIRFLVGALLALALVPATASAQAGQGDNYLAPIFLADQTHPMPLTPSVLGFDVDTTNYTTETGPIWGPTQTEFNQCGRTAYGKTVWSVLYTNRYGRLDVTAAGYDSVIGIASFHDPNDPQPTGGPCVDRLAGKIESWPRDALRTVKKNHWYAIQVGGAQQQDGTFAGGPLEVNVELLPPQVVVGDAILTWRQQGSSIKVTSVKVTGPSGAKITVRCSKKSCGKAATVNVKKPVSTQKFVKAGPLTKFKGGALKFTPDAGEVTEASSTVFKGRKIPSGARLQVIVTAPDQVGEIFYWDVKKGLAGTKNLGCLEPDSTTPRKFGSCDGK